MRYSIEPRDRIYVKGYGCLSFAKTIGRHANKVVKNLSAKKSTTYAIKTASKRAIQKTAETAGDLIGNKTADKIANVPMELHSKKRYTKDLHNDKTEEDAKITTH